MSHTLPTLLSLALLLAGCAKSAAPTDAAGSEDAPSEAVDNEAEAAAAPSADAEPTPTGDDPATQVAALPFGPFTVYPGFHATTRIEHGDTTIWLDPWSKAPWEDAPKADVVLITDVHFDHLDEEAIAKVATDATVFIAPQSVADKRAEAGQAVQHVLANGASVEVAGITITAVPMYNHTRGPEPGTLFHDPGRGNGYILQSGETRIYFAGDTACTDEMKALTDIDAAFIPMNLPYTMPPEEAAACVAAFKPAIAVPYHYAGSDLEVFTKALAGVDGVSVQRGRYYPGGLPW